MIYFDNHATTPVAPEVLEAMAPFWSKAFANPASSTHAAGREVAEHVSRQMDEMARFLGCQASELVITSGATESNNLAIFGVCLHPRQHRKRVLCLTTEHRAVLDPCRRLERHGFQVEFLPVMGKESSCPGRIDLDLLAHKLNDQVALVSVMLANNEIGVIQPIEQIAPLCRRWGVVLHTDATQAVGKWPIDVDRMDVDLMSFSAHKFYGPKGIGALYVRHRRSSVRLDPQVLGGGHQSNRRSGTLNVPGLVGMSAALKLCRDRNLDIEPTRALRDELWSLLTSRLPELELNGPPLDAPEVRLSGNLNCHFPLVEGQSLMLALPDLAVSSGSACTSAEPEASHVLQGIGMGPDEARCSLRFGLGRYNHADEVLQAAEWIEAAYRRFRA